MIKLTAHEIRRISVTALVSPKAVARCYAGEPVRNLTRLRIERAARELVLLPPPRPLPPSRDGNPRLSVVPPPSTPAADQGTGEEGSP